MQNTDTNDKLKSESLKEFKIRTQRQVFLVLKEYGEKPYSPDLRDQVRDAILRAGSE